MSNKTKIQLSLFPRFLCEICGDKLTHTGTTCKRCAKTWIEIQNTKNTTKT